MNYLLHSPKGFLAGAIAGIVLLCGSIYAGGDSKLLKVGQEAPEFSLSDAKGQVHTLSQFRGKQYVVLVFYPGDQTPVCTEQLCALRDDSSLFAQRNAAIFGVNPAGNVSHEKFAAKHGYTFPLLVDEKQAVSKQYGCDGFPMQKRTVYVVDPEGKIVFARRGKPDNADILKAIPAPAQNNPGINLDGLKQK
jgi:thioredoxin-dependent peroxiredoxin